MTHIKRQKLISSTQVRWYNKQFLLYPWPLTAPHGGDMEENKSGFVYWYTVYVLFSHFDPNITAEHYIVFEKP